MKNYTTLETIKASDLGDVFIPVSLTKEEFDAQKASGNIYKGFVPKNEITMLKFRYYTPDNILLEQNNVPVVYDGNAVETIINYYKISNENKGIVFNYASYASDGWTTTPQTTTPNIRFLWNVTETIFSNKAKQFTEPTIISVYGQKGDTGEKGDKGEKGEKGDTGATGSQGVRGEKYLGNYTNNYMAYERNSPDLFTGDYYLNSEDGLIYVYNEADNMWKEISSYDDYRYSLIIDDMFATIKDLNTNKKYEKFIEAKTAWFENLVANNAFLDNLFSNKIILGNKKNTNVDYSQIYIQSNNYDNKAKTGFRINAQGQAFFNNLNIAGDSTFSGKIDNSVIQAKPFEDKIITTERSQGSVIKDEEIIPYEDTKITYNGKQYDKAIVYAGGSNTDYWATLFFFNLNADYYVISDVFYYTGITAITYPYTMTWKTKLTGSPMELRFTNLPETSVSGKIGLVYVDNGFLKIVTK